MSSQKKMNYCGNPGDAFIDNNGDFEEDVFFKTVGHIMTINSLMSVYNCSSKEAQALYDKGVLNNVINI